MVFYVKILVFSLWLFRYEKIQEISLLVRRCCVISVAPLAFLKLHYRQSLSIPHPGFSVLYPEPSTYLDHFLLIPFHALSLPLSDTSSLCPCRYFQACFKNYLQGTNSPQKWRRLQRKDQVNGELSSGFSRFLTSSVILDKGHSQLILSFLICKMKFIICPGNLILMNFSNEIINVEKVLHKIYSSIQT